MSQTNRRRFLRTASIGGVAMSGLLPDFVVRADDAPKSTIIRYDSDLEPIVRLIEDTPRERCMTVLADKVRGGLSYQQFLAAVFYAAARTTAPHHTVFQFYSAYRISQSLPDESKLLPLFWAVDSYKFQQGEVLKSKKGHWPGERKREKFSGSLPPVDKAANILRRAIQRQDRPEAQRAIVALVRGNGARKTYDVLWEYSCMNPGTIGHHPIKFANCWRALEALGWRYAEPVLQYVVGMTPPDRSYHDNRQRVNRTLRGLPAEWATGKVDRGATLEMFSLLRQGNAADACDLAVEQLATTEAQPIWDALHLCTSELLTVHPEKHRYRIANRPLHCNTCLNALHFAFNTCQTPSTRLQILLQACAFTAGFARQLHGASSEPMKPVDLAGAEGPDSVTDGVNEIFSSLPAKAFIKGRGQVFENYHARDEIVRKLYALLRMHPKAASQYMQQARIWLTAKANEDAHEFKLAAALFEDSQLVSPHWRPHVLAATAKWLHGSQSKDNPAVREARDAME